MFVGAETVVVDVEPRISRKEFAFVLDQRGSPAAGEAGDAWDIITAEGVDPLFALALFHQESQLATDPESATARFDLRNPGHTRTSRIGAGQPVNTPWGQFMQYETWSDGWRDLAHRLVDPSFVYQQEGRRTVGPIIRRWAPASENDPENYIARSTTFMNQFASPDAVVLEDEEDDMPLQFGNVPHPPHERDIITKPVGFGQDDLGPRNNRGVTYHRTVGRSIRGTGEFFKLPGTGALTQYGVGAPSPGAAGEDGLILMWADPVGNVSPWASGPWENPAGDGQAFVARFGVNAINRDTIAIEISGLYDDPISDTTKDAVAAISAHWADRAQIPHYTYPLNPHTGVVYTYFHSEFQGHKPCPGPVVIGSIDDIIARTKAIMKAHQTGAA